ncbi:hypothetical protein EZV62_003678 [Acer yangbiense]|uniref:Serine-threonine/tyrosine-protein kinase catalytic domain-containing protein n=1 Tax=Acer yangbiense TaxID=1000413 RepID=A0A5C7IHH2_9ROSI|nr:hypothetical protein EZV62_003678 [Acer yangbiense]
MATEPQIPRDQQTPQLGFPSPQRYDAPLPIERDFSNMMPRGTCSLEDLYENTEQVEEDITMYFESNRLTAKSDVYSFGVVLLEIITNRSVITNTNENSHIKQWVGFMLAQGDIKNIVDQRLHGDFDSNSAWKIVELAMHCVSQTSIRRPTMSHVVIVLKDCLAMEMARTDGHGNEPKDQHEMFSVNMNSELAPTAR